MSKTDPGRFFEDFRLGETLIHATPTTLGEGERALYAALYPVRHAIFCSDAVARACGLPRAPLDSLLGFHAAFGATVPDVSLNAVANLGYAECRLMRPLYPGDEVRARSEVIGLRQLSNGKAGVVWVRSTAEDAEGRPVMEWARWVMVRKRDPEAPAPETVAPKLATEVAPEALMVPDGLDFSGWDAALAGDGWRWDDYAVGERIDHVDGATVQEAEHMMATRLWRNPARVHFDARQREDGRPLVYGGHVMSLARGLSWNGLAGAGLVVAINGGTHAAPCFAGDTVYARTEVLAKAETANPSVGALRLRLHAVKDRRPGLDDLVGEDGKPAEGVLLDLDYWALAPR